ncbi:alpha/beta fold hydrolase [Methylosinus sp. Sm6]|uniref:alpha/beta fold hydrolase n=1 Tax=Methylosinus sp. Sm6 TaxID=2866948 RepID=UPI001C995E86|nr:alpha/beta hydrolase [Methylosinus sp. Sm6]MBY6242907.1 alpha/beta hydrolase [Methylosinus sp. Sm6]
MAFAANRNLQLAYDVIGAGPDLLLIAGTSADRALWAQVRPALSERFRTIAFDNRDCGASGASPGDYGIGDLVDDTIAVLDAVGSERPHILGHSLGGMIAQEFALAHPERVASLTLANSWARRDTYVTSVFDLARDLSQSIEDDALRLRAIYFMALGVPILRTVPLAGMVEQVLAAGPAQSRQAVVRQWQIDLDADTLDRLAAITAPTHVIWSTGDKLLPEPHGRDLVQGIPNAFETVMDGIGHAPMIEDPAAFAAAVLGFLDSRFQRETHSDPIR